MKKLPSGVGTKRKTCAVLMLLVTICVMGLLGWVAWQESTAGEDAQQGDKDAHCALLDNQASCYIGLTEQEAIEKATANDQQVRVISIDGKPRPMTMDLNYERMNFSLRGGKVVDVEKY